MNPFDLLRAAGDRFSIVSAFPAALVVLYIFALGLTGAFYHRPDIHNFVLHSEHLGAGTVLLLALCVFLLALLLQPFQLSLVRLLEGYWGSSRPARVLSAFVTGPRRRMFARQVEISRNGQWLEPPTPAGGRRIDEQYRALQEYRRQLRLKEKADALRLRYPRATERVLPTALGNALRSFEDTAGQRYGLETIPAFRRLHPLMSPSLARSYAANRLQLDSAAGLCVAFVVMTLVSVPVLARDGWWLAIPVGTAVLAWISYRGAITSALLMGRNVTTAFDLHRHDLIGALRYAPAPDTALEYAFNIRLSRWLRGDDPNQPPAPQSMEDDYYNPPASKGSGTVQSESSDSTTEPDVH
jgi:hypothetical protein